MSFHAIAYVLALTTVPAPSAGIPVFLAEPLFGLAAAPQAGTAALPPQTVDSAPVVSGETAPAANSVPTETPAASPVAVPTASTATVSPQQNAAPVNAGPADSDAIVVISKPRPTKADPLAPFNAEVFGVTNAVDSAITGPTALAYKRYVPGTIRHALRHFINNLNEPVVSLNYLLQFKLGKSLETLGRLGINSTVGLGGLIDVAKSRPFNLPFRPNGFADTLGYYGVKPGPYFFLPLIGPTTLRDLAGGAVDMAVLPVAVGTPFNKAAFTLPIGVIDALDQRAEFETEIQREKVEPTDLYRARRAWYMQHRQAQIDALHSHPRPATQAAPAIADPAPPSPR